ncbi:MAG: DUF4189 domain-containing protein [Luteimonas sp.]
MRHSTILVVAAIALLSGLMPSPSSAQQTIPEQSSTTQSWGLPSGPWIAFAGSLTNSMTGFVYGESERLAERAALQMCEERGGGECEVEFTLELGCAAVVSGDGRSNWAYRPDSEDQAIRSARQDCGKECRLVWSGCTTPRSRRWR